MKLLVILFLIKGNLNYKIGLFQKKKRKKKDSLDFQGRYAKIQKRSVDVKGVNSKKN